MCGFSSLRIKRFCPGKRCIAGEGSENRPPGSSSPQLPEASDALFKADLYSKALEVMNHSTNDVERRASWARDREKGIEP